MPLYVTWLCGQRRHVALKVRPRVLGVEEQQVRALDNLRGSWGGAGSWDHAMQAQIRMARQAGEADPVIGPRQQEPEG